METVKTTEAPPSRSFLETRIICRVCEKQFSQYTCPRCNIRYCSLQCYKGHSLRCTESFMHDNVMEEMRQMKPQDDEKRKMLEILQRFHSDEEMDYEEEDVFADSVLTEETIQKILSGNNVSFDDLSAKEMQQFRRVVASGELSKMIEPWEPWWLKPSAMKIFLSQDGTQLVIPLDEQEMKASTSANPDDNTSEIIPAGPDTPLQQLSSLCHTNPSPLLPIHLVDVLYSYCFTLRLYNGDWQCDPLGASMVVLCMSSVLAEGGRLETVAEALGNCLERTCSPVYKHAGGFQFGLGLLDDVISVLSLGTNAMICLLSDLQRLALAGDRMLRSEKLGKAKVDETRSKLRNAKRKVYFLMCWVHEQPVEAWLSLAGFVEVEKASLKSVELVCRGPKGKGESKSGVLIEEV